MTWPKKLIIAEFAANNNESTFINIFFFFNIKNLHLYMSFGIVKLSDASICEQIFKQKALDIFGNIQII